MADANESSTRDLAQGVALAELADGGIVAGRVGEDEVVVIRRGDDVFAIGAHCTHYHGPLAEGLVVGDTVRCPWHHAEFCLRTGVALRAPALDAIHCYDVERNGERIVVGARRDAPRAPARAAGTTPASIVIVGGGAAGLAAADMLRREGFAGTLTMLSADDSPPVDRPNLSKDFLAGSAPDDWIPLRAPGYYTANTIDLVLGAPVTALDVAQHRIER